jgi:beta-lactamase regulating signal transducer with metallopeptidase domain
MLTLLIDLGWKSTLIAGLALIAHAAMRRRPAAERAALLQATLLALLALPLFALLLPALDIALLPARAAPAQVSEIVTRVQGATAPTFAWEHVALALYCAVSATLLLRFAIGVGTLRRWTRNARPVIDTRWQEAAEREAITLRRPVRLLVSSRAETPLSWGFSPAWILIGPATHDLPEQAEAVIAHEMAHIRRFDWLALVIARLTTTLFWFNPLAWLVARELSREAELAADAQALRHVSRHDYADALLAVAGGRLAHREANGMAFTRTALARRITAALDGKTVRQGHPRLQAALLFAAFVTAAPLAAAQLVAAQPLPPAPLPPGPAPVAPEAPIPPLPGAQRLSEVEAGAKASVRRADSASTRPRVLAMPNPRPSPVVSVANSKQGTTRIVSPTDGQVTVGPQGTTIIDGRTGARVVFGPNGVTLNGAPQESPATDAQRDINKGVHAGGGALKDGINNLLKSSSDPRPEGTGIVAEARRQTGG